MNGETAPAGATPYARLSGPTYRGGFAVRYGQLRPRPPDDLFALLLSLLPARTPELVVDLGSGTGISAVPWSGHARRVIGIELNSEMLHAAARAPGTRYVRASATQTGLRGARADIVTCAQWFHWMDPQPTIAEIARILRPGGVFAAYDYDWPPLADWEVDAAFGRVIEAAGVDLARPEKARHLDNLAASGRFRAVREVFLHSRELASAAYIARLPLVFGLVARMLAEGTAERDLGLDTLWETCQRRLHPGANVLWWSYRVRIAVA